MVKSWWNAGERWSKNGLKSAVKNPPHSSDLFLHFAVLGNGVLRPLLFLKAYF
jgi:hypothetical protein